MAKGPEKFETALAKLEGIAQKLEEGETSLEDSLKAFEEGMKLSKFCEEKLSEAQKKIEILIKDRDGKKSIKPFESEEE
ncbi:MAG: exodeoxyribonuclease VII small subunit [Deltaproteobacteria bacterium]|nr:exodeoxyribonuclease VII small subunit [Deltaproteobacteria bacterium]